MRILLVEDDPSLGATMQSWLQLDGYAVDWVRDGVAAELAVADHAYDLILLDLGLGRGERGLGDHLGGDELLLLGLHEHQMAAMVLEVRRVLLEAFAVLQAHGSERHRESAALALC